jgi:hypothetical protein
MTYLESLDLIGSQVTDAGLEDFGRIVPALTTPRSLVQDE